MHFRTAHGLAFSKNFVLLLRQLPDKPLTENDFNVDGYIIFDQALWDPSLTVLDNGTPPLRSKRVSEGRMILQTGHIDTFLDNANDDADCKEHAKNT